MEKAISFKIKQSLFFIITLLFVCFSHGFIISASILPDFPPDSQAVAGILNEIPADTTGKKVSCKNCDKTSPDYLEGMTDAHHYYSGNRAFTVCFVSTSLLPPAGLVAAIRYSVTPEKEMNLNMPYLQLKENRNYYCGYLKTADRTKVKKSWLGFGSGLVFFGTILYVVKISWFNE